MATYTDTDRYRSDVWPVGDHEVKQVMINRGARYAYNIINARLSGIYTVPFSATYPPIIVDISDMLTKCYAMMLSLQRGGLVIEEDQRTECTAAMKLLEDIAGGTLDIPEATRLSTRGASHNMEDYQQIFDLDSSFHHDPDINRLEDIQDERENT